MISDPIHVFCVSHRTLVARKAITTTRCVTAQKSSSPAPYWRPTCSDDNRHGVCAFPVTGFSTNVEDGSKVSVLSTEVLLLTVVTQNVAVRRKLEVAVCVSVCRRLRWEDGSFGICVHRSGAREPTAEDWNVSAFGMIVMPSAAAGRL